MNYTYSIDTMQYKYGIEFYKELNIDNLTLNENCMTVIQQLTNIYGESVHSTQSTKCIIQKPQSDANWKRRAQFSTTKLYKPEGIDVYINSVRTCLNKLSENTYDNHIVTINDNINNIINVDESPESINNNLTLVANSMFDIVSNNKFYSKIYANLYKDVSCKYAFFVKITDAIVDKYIESISSIVIVNPNDDYDKFCDMNRENDKRKSLITFIINLVKNDTLNIKSIINIHNHLDKYITSNIDIQDNAPINDEIIENLFILISDSIDILHKTDDWKNIKTQINTISTYKPKEHLGLSSRAKFKYMDMVTVIKKYN